VAAESGRPLRKLYRITAAGEAALAQVSEETRNAALKFASGLDPS
jgi:DNA-binding PadR family transcriptional regulator